MDWSSHPNLYQLTHWWHWLGYGQNSAVLSAIATLIAACAACAAGFYAYRAYVIGTRQLKIATDQYWDTHKAYLESVRPHLVIRLNKPTLRLSTPLKSISVTVINVGTGRAINIIGSEDVRSTMFSIAAGAEGSATILLPDKYFESITVFLRYSSVDGRRFRCETTIGSSHDILNEEEVDISAGIEPPSYQDLQKSKLDTD